MAIIQSGASSDLLTVDPTFKTARVTVRPPEGVGFYQLGLTTGTLTTGTNNSAPIIAMKWAPGNGKLAVIRKITMGFVQTAAWSSSTVQPFGLYIGRSYTVASSGGTAITIGTGNKMRFTNDSSLFTDVRVATTTSFTAGTRTLDTNPVAYVNFTTTSVASSSVVYPQQLYTMHDVNTGDHPIVLDNNEGFEIMPTVSFPAAGSAVVWANIEWYETTAY